MPSLAMQSLASPTYSTGALFRRVVNAAEAGQPPLSAGDAHQPLVLAWIILQLAGQITLPILVATMVFHKRVARRNPTIINLCIAWTAATIPPELLFYAGKYKGPEPSTMLCLLQAATISAVPPMAAMAYLSVVIHACTVMYEIRKDVTVRPFTVNLRMVTLLASPYIAFLAFALYVAFVGAGNSKDIVRDTFFCVVAAHNVSTPVFVFTITIVVFTLAGQCWIAYYCYKDYREKRFSSSNKDGVTTSAGVDLQFLFRMISFTIFEIVIVVACVSSIFNPQLTYAQLLLATPPFAVFLIFATSKDILSAWFPCFFPRDRSPPPTELYRNGSILNVSRADRTISQYSRSVYSDFSRTHQSQDSVTSTTSLIHSGAPGRMREGGSVPGSSLREPIRLHIPKQRSWVFEGDSATVTVQSGSSRLESPMDVIRSFKASSPASRYNPRPF